MSKKKDKSKRPDGMSKSELSELTRHLKAIGIITDPGVASYHWQADLRAPTGDEIRRYKAWCQDNGFMKKLSKSGRQRRDETQYVSRKKAAGKLDLRRQYERNPRRTLQMIFKGKLDADQAMRASGPFYKIAKKLTECSDPGRECFEQLIMRVDQHTGLLHHNDGRNNSYLDGVLRLQDQWMNWVRLPKDWKPRTHNAHRQFVSLAEHLLAKYEMPVFMSAAWLQDANKEYQDWYKHIGRGENIRTAKHLPFPLTKKMAHYFLKAPKEYSIREALRWGQVMGLGGDRRIMEGVRSTRMCQSWGNEDFWETVIRYFIRHPMLDTAQYNPICDYVHNQRFVPINRIIERGRVERLPPPQPNLRMKDRDPEALLREVDNWHTKLARQTRHAKHNWAPCGINEFYLEEGSKDKGQLRIWRITELLSSVELRAEGSVMGHCVGSYSQSCASGSVAIFSMTREPQNGSVKNMLTIEVRVANKTITQARGKRNELADAKTQNIMAAWAKQEGLAIASYVLRGGLW